ncbi:MAG: hypothetical protein Q4B67_10095, partial [Eubacteriales bacterium]|nr:hypothetical protein [Eubacteriales bacterium]
TQPVRPADPARPTAPAEEDSSAPTGEVITEATSEGETTASESEGTTAAGEEATSPQETTTAAPNKPVIDDSGIKDLGNGLGDYDNETPDYPLVNDNRYDDLTEGDTVTVNGKPATVINTEKLPEKHTILTDVGFVQVGGPYEFLDENEVPFASWFFGEGQFIVSVVNQKEKNHVKGAFRSNIEQLANAALTPGDQADMANGSDIELRMTVSDYSNVQSGDAVKALLDQIVATYKEVIGREPKTGAIKGISVKLDKDTGFGFEPVERTNGQITISITLPEDMQRNGMTAYLAFEGDGKYQLVYDLDTDPYTVTFSTDDFTKDYVLMVLDDSEEGCMWHWLIILGDLTMLVVVLFTTKRKKDDDEYWTLDEDGKIKIRKKSRNRRFIGEAALITACVIANIFGCCRLDFIFTVVSVIASVPTLACSYQHKFKEKKEEDQAAD